MRLFWLQSIFFRNADFKNECENVITKKNLSRNTVPHKIDFKAFWTHESIPTA